MNRKNITTLIVVALTALFLVFMFLPQWLLRQSHNQQTVQFTGEASIGGPFSLLDHTGRRRSEQDFLGRKMLVFFGYIQCPDVCPIGLQKMTMALELLGDKAAAVQPVFITIDPERDTVEQMASYVSHFHPTMIGLTGTAEEIKQTAKSFRIYYAKVEDGMLEGYLMDHSSVIYLMDEQGKFETYFNALTPPQEIADTLAGLI